MRYKTRLYGNYENRLRLHSDPEKVFEYFASVEVDGDGDGDDEERFMTPDDFLRAITPFNAAVHTFDDVRSRNTKYNFAARHMKPSAVRVPHECAFRCAACSLGRRGCRWSRKT